MYKLTISNVNTGVTTHDYYDKFSEMVEATEFWKTVYTNYGVINELKLEWEETEDED